MKKARQIVNRLGLGLVVAGIGVFGQPADTDGGLTSLRTRDIFVHEVTRPAKPIVGLDSIDWSPVTNRLLVGKPGRGRSGFHTVWTTTPEGINQENRLRNMKNNGKVDSGSASWHPKGKFFIFSSQKPFIPDAIHSKPLIGWHTDMWLANAEGTSPPWQLTNEKSTRKAPRGVTNPSFSPDGSKVVWSGNNGKISHSPWQQKAMFFADFVQEDGKPKLANIREFQPGQGHNFYEAYGFSPDGNRILFAANMAKGSTWDDMDICANDRRDRNPINFTHSPGVWDRFATYSPDGKKIIWTSNKGMVVPLRNRSADWQLLLKSELWIMDADGKYPKQLTFFNQGGHPHFTGQRVFLGDSAFSPDGTSVAVIMYSPKRGHKPESEVVMLKLGEGDPARFRKRDPKPPPRIKKPVPKPTGPKGKKDGSVTW